MGRGKRAARGTTKPNGVDSTKRRDRANIAKLDDVLRDFGQEVVCGDDAAEDRPVSEWRSCTFQNAACRVISEAFVEFARANGFAATLSDEVKGPEFVNNPGTLGYHDRPIEGAFLHTVALVYAEEAIYAIDWSAHQYGYDAFPLVSKYLPFSPSPSSSGWQSTWT